MILAYLRAGVKNMGTKADSESVVSDIIYLNGGITEGLDWATDA